MEPQAITPEYLEETTTGAIRALMALVIIFPTVLVCLRCYVRTVIRNNFGLDDAVAAVSTLFLIAYAAVLLAAADKGLGRHIEYIGALDNVGIVSMYAQIAQTLAIMACTLGKSAFAITLMRIFVQRWAITTLWLILVSMNLVNILCAIFVFAQCKDPRALWDVTIEPDCWEPHVFSNFSLFVGSYSAAQDFLLASLPIIIISRLNMKKTEKIGIVLSMSLGIFAGITAIVKCTHLVTLSNQTDRFYALPPLFLWAAGEDALAIVAATIPTLNPLLGPKAASTSSSNSYPLQILDKATDAFYPKAKRAELNTTIESKQGPPPCCEPPEDEKSHDGDCSGFNMDVEGQIVTTTQVKVTYD